MPRMKPLAREEAPEAAHEAMDKAAHAFDTPMTTAGIQARCPPILEAGRALGAAVAKSGTLPAELRFLVCVRVAQIVRCPFWIDTNAAGSSAEGSTDEKIAAVGAWFDSPLFSQGEKAAFAFAEGMTATPAEVTDEVYEAAAKHFSEAQLVELAATAAMENYRARLNRAFLVEAQGFYRPGAESRGG